MYLFNDFLICQHHTQILHVGEDIVFPAGVVIEILNTTG